MNSLMVMLITFSVILSSCQMGHRKPSSLQQTLNLQTETENILSDISNPSKFRFDNCTSYVRDVYQDVVRLSPTRFDLENAKNNWQTIYNNLWDIRVKLRERLVDFHSVYTDKTVDLKSCADSLRDGFRLSRWVEDYLAETFSGEPQDFKAGFPKNVHDSKFKPTPFQGGSPWLTLNPKWKNLSIRSGDIIISRGNAFTSSAIARIADIDSQFSHLAFIYIPGDDDGEEYTIEQALQNPKVLVIESHIEIGSTIRPFKDYVNDGNARNVIFRYKEASLAHESARWVYNYIQDYRHKSYKTNSLFPPEDVNHNVPYNFQMGLENPAAPKKLFCTQVAYVGFLNQGVTVPYYFSTLNTKLSLAKRLGVTSTQIYAPGDMEVDPRFEMVAEYRNLRKLKSLRMKDIVLSSMYRMMEDGYELTSVPKVALKSLIAWTLRQMDVKFAKAQLPKNMSTKILSSMLALENVAMYLEKELDAEEVRFKKISNGLPLGFTHGLDFLEELKQKDRRIYLSGKAPKFHWEFRPLNLKPESSTSP